MLPGASPLVFLPHHPDRLETGEGVVSFSDDVTGRHTLGVLPDALDWMAQEVFPSIEEYGRGEILLMRTLTCGSETYAFGDPKGFPKEQKGRIEEMVQDKMFLVGDTGNIEPPDVLFEKFMKLAGPYWMSCVTKNEAVPILDPDHYRTYLDRRT